MKLPLALHKSMVTIQLFNFSPNEFQSDICLYRSDRNNRFSILDSYNKKFNIVWRINSVTLGKKSKIFYNIGKLFFIFLIHVQCKIRDYFIFSTFSHHKVRFFERKKNRVRFFLKKNFMVRFLKKSYHKFLRNKLSVKPPCRKNPKKIYFNK